MNPQPFDRPPAAAGIVFALGVEADGFAAIASDVIDFHAGGLVLHEGFVADRRIAWCTSGAGIESASKATSLLIDGHRPRLIISAGFAGREQWHIPPAFSAEMLAQRIWSLFLSVTFTPIQPFRPQRLTQHNQDC